MFLKPDGPIGQRNPETRWLDLSKPQRERTRLNVGLEVGYRVVLPIVLGTIANFTIGNHGITGEAIDTLVAAVGINGGKFALDRFGSLRRYNRRLREQRAGYIAEIGTTEEVERRNRRDERIRNDGIQAGSQGSRITTRLSRAWDASHRPGNR